MTTRALLEHLRVRGVAVLADGEGLLLDGPEETLTEDICAEVARAKVDLLALLRAEAATPDTGREISEKSEERVQDLLVEANRRINDTYPEGLHAWLGEHRPELLREDLALDGEIDALPDEVTSRLLDLIARKEALWRDAVAAFLATRKGGRA